MGEKRTAGLLKNWAVRELSDSDTSTPTLDADTLLSYASGLERSHILAHPEKTIEPCVEDEFIRLVTSRAKQKPVAYMTGAKEFYSLSLKVSPAVLIPRPETELLVETALATAPSSQTLNVLDIGTGSGAIAVVLAVQRKEWRFIATDIFGDALAIARENAKAHGVIDRIEFIRSNIFGQVDRHDFDLIVANPPYIPEGCESVSREVSLYEPSEALYSGRDGLYHIASIIKDAASYLSDKGIVMIEIGYGQADAVKKLIDDAPGLFFQTIVPDLAGIDRVVVATKKNNG